jgi:hypothetical protein
LIAEYRTHVGECLEPLVRMHYPEMLRSSREEYRKMAELSTKMTLVGHACAETVGYRFDARRQRIATLFGGCCFLADSFLDDFGDEATRKYLQRFETLLTTGWFSVRTSREKLFYVVVARLFAEQDIMRPMVRQSILLLFEAQKRDVEFRLNGVNGERQARLSVLRQCARDRSGHAINVLLEFLVPSVSPVHRALMFAAGALIMFIDDHGDCYSDLSDGRITYMNQVTRPEYALRRIYESHIDRLNREMPANRGRDLLIAFLTRYYVTRIQKHRQQRRQGAAAWAVYE